VIKLRKKQEMPAEKDFWLYGLFNIQTSGFQTSDIQIFSFNTSGFPARRLSAF
jgi:hypothetical protein